MDLSQSIVPKSDQINADDLIGGPQTYTVREVKRGNAEQPIDIMLVETDRAYRPSKSMRRVLVDAWGKDSAVYAGRRLTLYRDPEVRFGADKVGGIKISHLSHIASRREIALTVTRGRRSPHMVEPLVDQPAEPTPEQLGACRDVEQLRAWLPVSRPIVRDRINARIAELDAPDEPLIPAATRGA